MRRLQERPIAIGQAPTLLPAQFCTQLYLRFATCNPSDLNVRRLKICGTADCKSALRRLQSGSPLCAG